MSFGYDSNRFGDMKSLPVEIIPDDNINNESLLLTDEIKKPLLEEISFVIEKGQNVAIVGRIAIIFTITIISCSYYCCSFCYYY